MEENKKSYQIAKQNWLRDRNEDLKSAAESGSDPSIWSRLGQYPEDFALGLNANRYFGGFSGPLSNDQLQEMDSKYQRALSEAKRTRKVPSGWSEL